MNFKHPIRWTTIIGWLIASYFIDGGLRGVFYGYLLLGLLAFLWYTIMDAWHRVGAAVSRPTVTVDARSVNLFPQEVKARRGVSVPPVTTDDFAGMIEYRAHQKNSS